MIQDLSGLWYIKRTDQSTLAIDSSVPLMHLDPDRSWITDAGPDHPKDMYANPLYDVGPLISDANLYFVFSIKQAGRSKRTEKQ